MIFNEIPMNDPEKNEKLKLALLAHLGDKKRVDGTFDGQACTIYFDENVLITVTIRDAAGRGPYLSYYIGGEMNGKRILEPIPVEFLLDDSTAAQADEFDRNGSVVLSEAEVERLLDEVAAKFKPN